MKCLAANDYPWIYDDGGRLAAGFKGAAGDCVVRAVAIATGKPYRDVYDALRDRIRALPETSKTKKLAASAKNTSAYLSPRNGVPREVYEPYLVDLGFVWVPTMTIGAGCKVHLRADELPPGRVVVRVSKHVCAVIDGVIHDTYDPSRDGTRCVYGFYSKE